MPKMAVMGYGPDTDLGVYCNLDEMILGQFNNTPLYHVQ